MASSNKQEAKGKVLSLQDALGLVAYQGLRPDMAIRACNNPSITNTALSREISKLVVSVAKNEIERRCLQVRALNAEEQEEVGGALVARSSSPVSKSSPFVNSTSTFLDLRFGTPYLKNGPSHFQRKVASKIRALKRDRPSLPQPVLKKARNDIDYDNDTSARYDDATKEATKLFADMKAGKVSDRRTQQEIVDDLNQKYSLNGEGREDSREKHMLKVRTVQRLVQKGIIGSSPVKRGQKPRISPNQIRLVQMGIVGSSPVKRGQKPRISPDQIRLVGLHVSKKPIDEDDFENDSTEIPDQIRLLGSHPTNKLLLEKAKGAFQTFEEKGSVLAALSTEDLKHLVRFFCHVEKKKGDTFSKHSGSKEKMQERLTSVEPSWTKYFTADNEGDTRDVDQESTGATDTIPDTADNEGDTGDVDQESTGATDTIPEGSQGGTDGEGGGANNGVGNDSLRNPNRIGLVSLLDKAQLAFQIFRRRKGSDLTALSLEDLKDLVRYICHVEKKKGDTFSKHSGSKEKMRERLASVKPSWTKYFTVSEEGGKGAAGQESAGATDATAKESQGGTDGKGGRANGGLENDAVGAGAIEC